MAGEPGERRGAHGSGVLGRGHSHRHRSPAGSSAGNGGSAAPRVVQGIGGGVVLSLGLFRALQ